MTVSDEAGLSLARAVITDSDVRVLQAAVRELAAIVEGMLSEVVWNQRTTEAREGLRERAYNVAVALGRKP